MVIYLAPEVSIHINEPVENYQVGQSGYDNEAEVGLPGDCSEAFNISWETGTLVNQMLLLFFIVLCST